MIMPWRAPSVVDAKAAAVDCVRSWRPELEARALAGDEHAVGTKLAHTAVLQAVLVSGGFVRSRMPQGMFLNVLESLPDELYPMVFTNSLTVWAQIMPVCVGLRERLLEMAPSSNLRLLVDCGPTDSNAEDRMDRVVRTTCYAAQKGRLPISVLVMKGFYITDFRHCPLPLLDFLFDSLPALHTVWVHEDWPSTNRLERAHYAEDWEDDIMDVVSWLQLTWSYRNGHQGITLMPLSYSTLWSVDYFWFWKTDDLNEDWWGRCRAEWRALGPRPQQFGRGSSSPEYEYHFESIPSDVGAWD